MFFFTVKKKNLKFRFFFQIGNRMPMGGMGQQPMMQQPSPQQQQQPSQPSNPPPQATIAQSPMSHNSPMGSASSNHHSPMHHGNANNAPMPSPLSQQGGRSNTPVSSHGGNTPAHPKTADEFNLDFLDSIDNGDAAARSASSQPQSSGVDGNQDDLMNLFN